MSQFRIRTDLAVEETESFQGTEVEIPGVVLEKHYNKKTQVHITRVEIKTEEGAKAMQKPIGTYFTLEAKNLQVPDKDYHREVSVELAKQIRTLLPDKKDLSVLIVGLGNREATPDSLGPRTVDNMHVNRHVIMEYGREAMGEDHCIAISGIVPGVMAQTGMESAEIVKAIIEEIKPDVVIAIDSLAARSVSRLNTTIQVTNTGINPGSGVGNHRCGLTEESLGIPVIALGIPTVVDAATIVSDTMDSIMEVLVKTKGVQNTKWMEEFNPEEKHQLIRELMEPNIGTMYVTPKDVDETIKMLSFTVSEALNIALEKES